MNLKELEDHYPYISIGRCGDTEIVGVIQNASKTIVAIYDLTAIESKQEKDLFLKLSKEYWWHSNRKIPIDIFMKESFGRFKRYLKSYSTKEYEHIHGPLPTLSSIASKRPKKRKITISKKK